jgi:hypothetical protein
MTFPEFGSQRVVNRARGTVLLAASLCCCFAGCSGAPNESTGAGNPPAQPASGVAVDPAVQAELQQLVRESYAAHGGEKILERLNRGRITMSFDGELGPGLQGQARIVDTFDGPGRFRREVAFTSPAQRLLFVINGETGWMKVNDEEPRPMPQTGEPQESFLVGSFKILDGMQKGEYELAPAEGPSANATRGIQVFKDDMYFGDTYFDTETKLSVGSYKSLFDPTTNKDVEIFTFYHDHKSFDGCVIPTRMEVERDGTPYWSIGVEQVEFLDTIPDETFAKPGA